MISELYKLLLFSDIYGECCSDATTGLAVLHKTRQAQEQLPLNINLKESEGEKCAAVVTTALYRSTPPPTSLLQLMATTLRDLVA